MLNIKILLFCWKLPSIPSPPRGDHMTPVVLALSLRKMAAVVRDITLEETELLSFLRQNIQRKLHLEAERQGLSKRDPRVVQAVVRYFSLGALPNHFFNQLVWRLAHDQ